MTSEELPLRRIVACASGLIYWGGVLVHARRVRRQIGRSPNVKPRGSKERVLWLGWLFVILVWVGQPLLVKPSTTTPAIKLIESLLHPASLAVGFLLIALGYAGTLWTYAVMGNNWRMGVNPRERTVLVCDGLFRWVRHPIYMLQVVMLLGVALLLPTPLSFVVVSAHFACVWLKARDEEKYLVTVHGRAYADYCARTGMVFVRLIRRRTAEKHS